MRLAESMFSSREYESAQQMLDTAATLSVNPADLDHLDFLRGEIEFFAGDLEAALGFFSSAVRSGEEKLLHSANFNVGQAQLYGDPEISITEVLASYEGLVPAGSNPTDLLLERGL